MLGKFGPEVWVQECRVYILKADSRTLKTRRSEALNPKPIWIGDLWVFLQPRKFKILQKPTDSVRFLQISILQNHPQPCSNHPGLDIRCFRVAFVEV